jgi:hypothetical protein
MPKSAIRHFVLAFLLLAATGCSSEAAPTGEPTREPTGEPTGVTPDSHAAATAASRTGLVYAAVVRQLVEVDHGFGNAKAPYRRVYVIDGAVPHASHVRGGVGFRRVAHPFDADVKEQIIQQLDGARPLAFVNSRAQVIGGPTSRWPGEVIKGGVLLTLGPVKWINNGTARVANNRWAAGKDGQWLVYTVKLQHRHWRVTGIHGAVTLS